ncbi:MAG: arylsulfatase [Planctomycetota bacterium]
MKMLTRVSALSATIAVLSVACSNTDVASEPAVAKTSAKASKPNIVVVITDDQGYGDLGSTGNRVLDTPHLDRLAAQSARLTSFYVSPVCAPTRASLMTGRYNYRTRVVDTWVGRAMMEPSEVTVAEALRAGGYKTGVFGKWHLGDCYPLRPDDQGFEETLVHRGGGLAQPSEPIENERRYTDPILFRNGKQVQTKGYCTDVYFDAALQFMEDSKRAGKPFFVYLPTNAPHGPFHDVPEELLAKYEAQDLSSVLLGNKRTRANVVRAFAMIENVDQNIGKLTKKIKELEIKDDTIVVFLHDNGPNSRRYVGKMRGMKTEVHEGGIRSPLFVRWPKRLRPGIASNLISAHIDIMPTLLDAAGVPAPEGVKLDGISLLPLLERKKVQWPDRTIVIQTHRGDAPVRYHHFAARTQEWKLVRPSGFGRQTPPDSVGFELYNIPNDPTESRNLVREKPHIFAKLKAEYDRWFDDVGSTRKDNYAPPRIVIGNNRETRTPLTLQDWRRESGNGWGTNGHWLVNFEGDHSYRVTVNSKSPLNGNATLRVEKQVYKVGLAPNTREFEIQTVKPLAGDAKVSIEILDAQGKAQAPYHVIFDRQ